MIKKRFWIIAALFAILLSFSAFALEEKLKGISADSPAYIGYQACVDSCKNCADNCRFNAYRMAAEIESNEELCKQLPENLKDMCINRVYASKALAAMDATLCENILPEEEKGFCLLNVQIEKAVSNNDKTECNSVPQQLETACKYAYYMRKAILSKDASYCNNIGNEVIKANCNANIPIQDTDSITPVKQCDKKRGFHSWKIGYVLGIAALVIILGIMLKARKKNSKINNENRQKKKKR